VALISWKTKIAIQWVLAQMPGGERINHALQHAHRRYTPERLRERVDELEKVCDYIAPYMSFAGADIVEVGTGWLLIAPLVMVRRGARRVHTYDHIRHMRKDLTARIAGTMGCDLEESMRHVEYHAPADAADSGLPDHSIDLFFTFNVLEHMPLDGIVALIRESKRLLRPGGVAYHAVGLGDHYAEFDGRLSRVNFLQYSDRWWNFWVQNHISYHNRLREKEFLAMFREQGAEILDVRSMIEQSDVAVIKNGQKLAERFRGMTPEELATHYMEVVYRFAS
jgi:SAM-dependent methyltransferase